MGNLPFRLRLIIAALLPLLVVIIVINWLVNETFLEQFQAFQVQRGQEHARGVRDILSNYYANLGSWDGVNVLFQAQGPGAIQQRIGDRSFMLADKDGRVFLSSEPELLGQQLIVEELEQGVPIEVGEGTVATLLVGPVLENFSPVEERFLATRNSAILAIGILGAMLGTALVLAFYKDLAVFMRRFIVAAQKIASGDFHQRIKVNTKDEIAELAKAFNEMAARLENVQQIRSNMIADIAHELRTPLTVIQADVEALVTEVLPLTKATLSSIYERSLILSRLIDDLMTLHLAEIGEMPLYLQRVDLSEMLGNLVSYLKPSLIRDGIHIELQTPQGLPPIELDVERMEQVFLNMLNNSKQHMPKGGAVRIEVALCADRVCITVSDNGSGIAHADLPFVFERFYRARSLAQRGKGVGLGLAIAKRLIESHKGTITVDSQWGMGTTFKITLPWSHDAA